MPGTKASRASAVSSPGFGLGRCAYAGRSAAGSRYAGHVASVDLDGELIAGSLPNRALSLVTEWARLHHDELHANWERARREEPLRPIEPLP